MTTNRPLKKIIKAFLKGLLVVIPIAITIYVITQVVNWLDDLLPVPVPGLSLVLIVAGLTLIGFMAKTYFMKPLFDLMYQSLERIPLVNILFSSISDVLEAFVGDNKKFNNPVLVALDGEKNLLKPGFVTQQDLSELGKKNYVCVYLPHSYNFSGNLFMVKSHLVEPFEGSSAEIMKFIVSGGIGDLNFENKTAR